MASKIYVSKNGFASCPSCLSHVRLDVERDKTRCPFCEEKLEVAALSKQSGSGTMKLLRHSRSGMVATALAGAGLSLTMACGEPDPDTSGDVGTDADWSPGEQEDAGGDTDVEYEYTNYENIQQDYGGYANYYENEEQPLPEPDAGVSEDAEGGTTTDAD